MTRPFWIWMHRWIGLIIGPLLVLTALTGSLLTFKAEIDEALGARPSLTIEPQRQPLLDPLTLRDFAQRLEPTAQLGALDLQVRADRLYEVSVSGGLDPLTRQPVDLGYERLQLNPYTGELVRRASGPSLGHGKLWPISRHNLMDVVYALHTRLAMPGQIGAWVLGAVAVAWTVDCFVGLYLTFPIWKWHHRPGPGANTRRSIWRRWLAAWRLTWRGKAVRIHFKLHVAASLWTWAMLFVFAWSSVYFELGPQVYQPVMGAFGMKPMLADFYAMPELPAPRPPALSWRQAVEKGDRLVHELAPSEGFVPDHPIRLQYEAASGLFIYMLASSRSPDSTVFGTLVVFDGDTGRLWGVFHLTGQDAGTTISAWLSLLHQAQVGGTLMRIFVCAMGLVTTMLAVTGAYLWLRRRRARQVHATEQANLCRQLQS